MTYDCTTKILHFSARADLRISQQWLTLLSGLHIVYIGPFVKMLLTLLNEDYFNLYQESQSVTQLI